MKLTKEQRATVVAALAYWRDDLELNDGEVVTDELYFRFVKPLNVDEIDALIKQIEQE